MSKKSRKKKKARKKTLKKHQASQIQKQPVLTDKPEKTAKAPKVSGIEKIRSAIKEKKAWKIAFIFGTVLLSLFIQYYVFNVFDPEMIQTNAAQITTSAQEAYKISTKFDIIDTESTNPGYYLATGEIDKDIYSFAVKSTGDAPLILEELILTKTGEMPEEFITNIRLFEGENAISEAEFKNDKLVFKKITSILQPGTEKKYVVKADVSKEGASGVRFRFSLVNPTDIIITLDKDPVYSLDTFPFDGAYATIVGWRKK